MELYQRAAAVAQRTYANEDAIDLFRRALAAAGAPAAEPRARRPRAPHPAGPGPTLPDDAGLDLAGRGADAGPLGGPLRHGGRRRATSAGAVRPPVPLRGPGPARRGGAGLRGAPPPLRADARFAPSAGERDDAHRGPSASREARGGQRGLRQGARAERPHAGAAHRRGAGLELRRSRPGLVRARALVAGTGGHRPRPWRGGDARSPTSCDSRSTRRWRRPTSRCCSSCAPTPRWPGPRRRGRWRSPPSRARRTTAPGRRSSSATPRPSAGPTPRPSARCARPSTSSAPAAPGSGCRTTSGSWPGRAAAPDGPPRGWRCWTRRWPRSRSSNERWWDAELHRLRGDLRLAAGGGEDEARAAYGRSLEVARSTGAPSLALRAATSLARLTRTPGPLERSSAR